MADKIIFLDIDGVMKPGRSYFCPKNTADHYGGFDPLAIAAINRLHEKTGAVVVFNTTWNIHGIEDIAPKQGLTAPIAGKTQYPHFTSRKMAIESWLEKNPCEAWVALDDARIDHPNAIRVDPEIGISPQNYRDACRMLGNPDAFMLLL